MTLSSLFMAGKFVALTSYFSFTYLAMFLPVCLIIYSVLPQKFRRYYLILASYAFFWFISGQLIIYRLISTLSIHYFGLWLQNIQQKRDETVKLAEKENRKAIKRSFLIKQRYVLLLAAVIHFGMLLVFKYTEFFTTNINSLFSALGFSFSLTVPKYIMPIGISFFTMQAMSYIFDVYHGVIKAEENIFKLALFMSFFPQIVEGPICRYAQTDGTHRSSWTYTTDSSVRHHNVLSLPLRHTGFH